MKTKNIIYLLLAFCCILVSCSSRKAFTPLKPTYYFRIISQNTTATFLFGNENIQNIKSITLPTWEGCESGFFKRGAFTNCTKDKLEAHINETLVIPSSDLQNKTEGYISCHFILSKDGTISKIKIQESPSFELGKALSQSIQNLTTLSSAQVNKEEPISTEIVLKVFCDIVLR